MWITTTTTTTTTTTKTPLYYTTLAASFPRLANKGDAPFGFCSDTIA